MGVHRRSRFDQCEFDAVNPDINKTFRGNDTSLPCRGGPPINPGNTDAYAARAALHAWGNAVGHRRDRCANHSLVRVGHSRPEDEASPESARSNVALDAPAAF